MREEIRQKLEQNENKISKPKRGRPAGHPPALKNDPAYWAAELAKLGLTMQSGVRDKLLYDNESNFGMDENGERLLLHEAVGRSEKLNDRLVRFYAELSHEHDALAWKKVMKQEKLLTAHNRRLIARKRSAIKSLWDRGKITKAIYEQASESLVPAALAWQAMGLEEDDDQDPDFDLDR